MAKCAKCNGEATCGDHGFAEAFLGILLLCTMIALIFVSIANLVYNGMPFHEMRILVGQLIAWFLAGAAQ